MAWLFRHFQGEEFMNGKIIAWVSMIVAVIMGLVAVTIHIDYLNDVVMVMKFFETALVVLAVGALVKYLCGSCH